MINAACASSDSLSGQTAPASNRPTWSGLLQLSLVGIPVKAYPAVRTTEASHFHLLHADCGERIRYAKHCPVHGAVDAAAIVRGFAYAPGRHVVLAPAELDALRPARDRALRLEHFMDLWLSQLVVSTTLDAFAGTAELARPEVVRP